MLLGQFAPPGNADPLDPQHAAKWSEVVKSFFQTALVGHPDQVAHDAPRPQFYDPTATETADDAAEATITWSAFPRQVALAAPGTRQRWELADSSRARQDEYCEWSVMREGGRITSIQFTCEPPEYWRFLAAVDPERVVALYRQFVSRDVQEDDLFVDDRYVLLNRWNSTTDGGAMHLIHRPNSLSAEIELAAASSIVREIPGEGTLMEEQELIACGEYGNGERNSDPHIGGEVNALTRQRADVTLADPVGLYIDGLRTELFETPDGSDPQACWTVVRGDPERAVRAVFEVPDDRFAIEEILIDGQPIAFGAQLADHITMKLVGVACRLGASDAEPLSACVSPLALEGAASLQPPTVEIPDLGEFELASRAG